MNTSLSSEENKPVVSFDFEGEGKGSFLKALRKNKLTSIEDGVGIHGSKGLRVTYEGFDRGSKRVVIRDKLPGSYDLATLSFYVQFDKDFQWVGGGKLHGLGPSKPITGGGKMEPNGWSSRIMWKSEGMLRSYLYAQNKPGEWGWSISSPDPIFQKGTWHAVSIITKLNTPEIADGAQYVFIDGKLIIQHEGVIFRGNGGENTKIRQLLFSTFHGGNKPKWAPKNEDGSYATVYANFDNITVHEGKFILPPLKQ